MKKIKLLTTVFTFIIGITFFSACGGSNTSSDERNATESQNNTTKEVTSEVLDPDAKSDSKGVGRFTSVDVSPTIDKEMATKGQAVFETKCTPCHKTTADKLVGPGLKNITDLRTPEWVMNMITNPEEMTKKDPVAKALFEKHLVQMTFQNVDDKQTREIYEYLRQNDKN
ncbi:MAG: cytochrome c [Bacteroidetes bacterium]|nr:cytochrome c [Bacteroidota bacterium]MBU1372703.1 cytochrome c [Bacteroidota bacterium]MBU1484899.1 cytochrome c [Bacteroidota bacterium]MBU1761694.1 cytochrome c [Bacteroidota bacterium]MBU2045352.1 cytochrome c [Bacteroidota bacterium]